MKKHILMAGCASLALLGALAVSPAYAVDPDAALAAMHTPAVRERLTDLGAEIVPDDEATPQHLGEYVKSEIAKWAVPIKASGVTVE